MTSTARERRTDAAALLVASAASQQNGRALSATSTVRAVCLPGEDGSDPGRFGFPNVPAQRHSATGLGKRRANDPPEPRPDFPCRKSNVVRDLRPGRVPRLALVRPARSRRGSLPAFSIMSRMVMRASLERQCLSPAAEDSHTFARCRDLLRQDPVQAADRADLREKLRGGGGGVVFTTIQKLMPAESGDRNAVLSDRRNIVVIADEAHRSQYDFIDGFARHMGDALPQSSLAAFNETCTWRNVERRARIDVRLETLEQWLPSLAVAPEDRRVVVGDARFEHDAGA